ncbi:MAG: ABC transporter substrate-binding protein [Chloroflexi bacterium]|nr:ABC transporter substrate-binding protein [Chloroflexota bacterium]
MNLRSRPSLLRFSAFLAVASLVAVACGTDDASTPTVTIPSTTEASKPQQGGVLRRVVFTDPFSFDLHSSSSSVVLMTGAHFYNNLLWNPGGTAIECDVCSSWNVEDGGKRMLFHLRDNVAFADGHLLTSSDVKYSLQKMMGLVDDIVSPRAGVIKEYIESIDTPDDATVALNLYRPAAALPAMLTMQFASMVKEGTTRQDLNEAPDGTGAFLLKSWESGSKLVLERNPNYFKEGLPYLDELHLIIIGNPVAGRSAFLTNLLDIGAGPNNDTLSQYEAKRAAGDIDWVEEISEFRPQGVMMNVTQPPFDDILLRQAVNLAIDRWGYMQVVHENRAEPALIFRAGIGSMRTTEEIISFPGFAQGGAKDAEREQARNLLAQAGFPDGLDVVLTVRNAPDYRIQGEFLSGELAKIGIRTTLELVESAALFPKVARLDYSIWGYWFGQTTNDPDEMWASYFLTDGSRNYLGYSNPEVDRLFVQQSLELDPVERASQNRQLEDIILADLPFAPTVDHKRTLGWWTQAHGFKESRGITRYTTYRGELWWTSIQ